ncbi:hypothetical protein [Methylobacterium sp. JK268]
MFSFIDEHREVYGVVLREPQDEADLQGAADRPVVDCAHAARRADPDKQPVRARSGAALMIEIPRVFEASFGVNGVRKVWLQLSLEGSWPRDARWRG